MSTLICLLSGQPVPNLMSCAALHPDRIVLVQTFRMKGKNVADRFQNALKKMGILVDTEVVDVEPGQDNHFSFLKDYFRSALLEAYSGDTFLLNLTGGTKPMSIALYETFLTHPGVKFYYFDFDSPCEIMDFIGGGSSDVGQIPLEAFLAGYGFKTVKSMKHIEAAENAALERAQTTRFLASCCNDPGFGIWKKSEDDEEEKASRAWLVEAMRHKTPSTLKEGLLHPSDPKISRALADCFHLEQNADGTLSGTVNKYDVKYLDGGWLEEFIWLTLHHYERKYELGDLHLGQVIQKEGSKTSNEQGQVIEKRPPQNEVDVSFMRNNTFHVWECKTDFQEKLPLYLYKLYAVLKELEALGTRSSLISNCSIITTDESKERAKLHSTKLIDAESIHNLAIDPEKELEKIFNPSRS
ncbi:MAG: DUF1887 family CARF protein [Thermoguttaceae bacterium]|nr:DUF1887 family CARF protein [Thermoguttaceae bacterium]